MLANSLFSHSKRYPNLFRYVVEQALEGRVDRLKERTLGVEVFGRAPDYDTTEDPVVRMTAGEIRKRIAQYYHEPVHQHELRIDLPCGSYIPEFHSPAAPPMTSSTAAMPRRIFILAPVLLAAAALTIAWMKPWAPAPGALDQFWSPILNAPSPVLLCVGQPRTLVPTAGTVPDRASQDSITPVTVLDLHRMNNQHVALSDATTLSRIAGLLQSRGKAYRIRGRASTSLADLRDGPAVLIGAFNNDWTLRLTGQQRFIFEKDPDTPHVFWIRDQEHPANKDWRVDYSMPYVNLTEDYAIISRVLDKTLDRMVVVAGGITKFGTIAAGEFLTDPGYMHTIAQHAPRYWEHKNFEAVIATTVINGSSGPPRLVATHFWDP